MKLAPCKLLVRRIKMVMHVPLGDHCKSCEIVDNLYNCMQLSPIKCLIVLTNGWEVMCACFAWHIKILTSKVMKYSKAYYKKLRLTWLTKIIDKNIDLVEALWSQCYKIHNRLHSVITCSHDLYWTAINITVLCSIEVNWYILRSTYSNKDALY